MMYACDWPDGTVRLQVSFGPYYTFFSLYLDQHGYRASSLGLYWAIAVTVEIVVVCETR